MTEDYDGLYPQGSAAAEDSASTKADGSDYVSALIDHY